MLRLDPQHEYSLTNAYFNSMNCLIVYDVRIHVELDLTSYKVTFAVPYSQLHRLVEPRADTVQRRILANLIPGRAPLLWLPLLRDTLGPFNTHLVCQFSSAISAIRL